MMETTSTLPFAGAFGLARCTIGFYAGFMVGIMEALEYVTYTATSALSLANMICSLGDYSLTYTPAICFLFYLSALYFHIKGGAVFWYFNGVMCFVSITLLLIYCFGSLPWVNFQANAGYSDPENPTESKKWLKYI